MGGRDLSDILSWEKQEACGNSIWGSASSKYYKKKKKSKTNEEAKSTPNQDHLILLHARCIMGITTNHTLKSLIFLC